jgi:hypothetical protein
VLLFKNGIFTSARPNQKANLGRVEHQTSFSDPAPTLNVDKDRDPDFDITITFTFLQYLSSTNTGIVFFLRREFCFE